MGKKKRFESSIRMWQENLTFTVAVSDSFLHVTVDNQSCSLNVAIMFEPASVDDVRQLAHTLLKAADVLVPPSKN